MVVKWSFVSLLFLGTPFRYTVPFDLSKFCFILLYFILYYLISDFDEERVRLRQENKEREKKQKQVELRLKRMQAFQARSELQEVDTEGDILILF